METNSTSYHFFLSEAAQWLLCIVFGGFIISRWRRWNQLKHISTGYLILGQVVIIILLLGLVLMMFGQTYLVFFQIIIFTALLIWEEYNTWYYSRLNVSLEELQAIRQPVLPNKRIYVPMRRFLKYLLSPPEEEPFWARHNFRNALLWLGAMLLCAYGFSRAINAYTQGLVLVAKEQKKAADQLAAVARQSKQVAVLGKLGRDSIAAELRRKNQADSIRYLATKGDRQKYFIFLNQLKNDINRKSEPKPVAPQPTTLFIPPLHHSLPKANPLTPDRVKVPDIRKGRKTAELEQADTTQVARNYPQ